MMALSAMLIFWDLLKISFDFPLGIPLLNRFPLVIDLFSLAKTNFHFSQPLFGKEYFQWDNRVPLFFHFSFEFAQFPFRKEQFTLLGSQVIICGAMRIFRNVQTLHPEFALVEETIAVVKACLSLPQRFNFSAGK